MQPLVFGYGDSLQFGPVGPGGAAAEPWWLSGGIAAGDCIVAYQAKGAADYAASLVNLNGPGVNDATPLTGAPTFNAALGWVGVAGCSGLQVTGYATAGGVYSVLVRETGTPNYVIYVDTVAASGLSLASRGAGNSWALINGANLVYAGRNGVHALITQMGADQEVGYFNGVQMGTNWTALTVPNGLTLICGPLTNIASSIAAVVWYSTRITPAQVLAVSTAMAAL